ncbi:MAG: flagellar hook-basal body protein [Desulfobacterales bacterium]|nr:flagellar hook-basal body protein [Desulfobacterales bacterium]
MIHDMTKAVQGALLQERKFEIVANHLANVNTPGFKGDIMSFDNILKAEITVNHSQGSMQDTGNPLDMAIGGDGFFKIQTANGVRYTRAGNFTLDNQNNLVNQNGAPVLGIGGANIVIDGSDVQVSQTGEIFIDGESTGQLEIVTFQNLNGLTKTDGANFINENAGGETAASDASVIQGSVEGANVQTVTEMVKMIESMRTYEAATKVIQSIDETNTKAVTEVGMLS